MIRTWYINHRKLEGGLTGIDRQEYMFDTPCDFKESNIYSYIYGLYITHVNSEWHQAHSNAVLQFKSTNPGPPNFISGHLVCYLMPPRKIRCLRDQRYCWRRIIFRSTCFG